jgi:SAM-dependent methyltransferase
MANEVQYIGRDLEAMSIAVNYHRWIFRFFEPYLGTRVVEVGAGIGSFSRWLLERKLERLSLVEPSMGLCEQLEQRVQSFKSSATITIYNSTFRDVAPSIKDADTPDSIIYVNVLEHIADDEAELRAVNGALGMGGHLFVFVPALPCLFGAFDREIGHVRRYTKRELNMKCQKAGFEIQQSRYFDLIGIAPWWIKYKLLNSNRLESSAVDFYDRNVVPVSRLIERFVRPPAGKNLVLIAKKTGAVTA